MGIFDGLFGKKNQGTQASSTSVQHNVQLGGLNLTKEQAVQKLNLRKEAFQICLTKKSLTNTVARVAVAMDKSGSMSLLYKDGTVQAVIERLLPSALKFDDDGSLDMWLFADRAKRLDPITESEFYDYVRREILDKRENGFWGGTKYAPVINDIVRKYTVEEPSILPTFVIFITDGENSDKDEAKRAVKEASKHNIFFQFIGIGDERFTFLKTLDTMEGRTVDNANFFEVNDINHISDEKLYDLLLNEFPSWVIEAKKIGILK